MTLLDTEQSYVESLRTLMQVMWHGRGYDTPNHVPCLSLSLEPQVGTPV